MKECIKCKLEKQKSEFYGVQGDCKDCTKKRVKLRLIKLSENQNWVEKEKKRNREKYHRLGYKNRHKPTYEKKKAIMDRYKEKYPEKIKAKNNSSCINVPDGFEKHHWSYNEDHYKDVMFLSNETHNKLHRFMIYDQERKMYRVSIDTYRFKQGELLDRRLSVSKFLHDIKLF